MARAAAATLPAGDPARRVVPAIVLAAGRSARLGTNKMLVDLGGTTMVERAVDAAVASRAVSVLVVVGHEASSVRARLAGRPVTVVENAGYADGLATSLRAGLDALPAGAGGALVMLADMPDVTASLVNRLLACFALEGTRDIVAPVRGGRRGHPVVWARRFFDDLRSQPGDVGGRALIDAHPDAIEAVAVADDAPFLDIDTPRALAAYRRRTA